MAAKLNKAFSPWLPADYELADATAIQAVAKGEASPEQQQRAMRFIVEEVAATYQSTYIPGSDRDTAFAEGRRHVGLQLVKFIKLNLSILRSKQPS
jgi:hypothetical protein